MYSQSISAFVVCRKFCWLQKDDKRAVFRCARARKVLVLHCRNMVSEGTTYLRSEDTSLPLT
jgi:hypothetical protein